MADVARPPHPYASPVQPTDEIHEALPGIDPDDLAVTVRVLKQLHHLPDGHADIRTVKHAASHMYKALKAERRTRKREAELAADRAVTEATATGSPMRIDDETRGIPLVSSTRGAFAGELVNARGCYVCKNDYTLVDAFYHWLCPSCARSSHAKREQGTDLSGRRALLTGGRAKIGMYIALRLLRDGAHTTITTRFPHDAVRRFAALEDSADWVDRLTIVGIDLRDPTQVMALADEVTAAGRWTSWSTTPRRPCVARRTRTAGWSSSSRRRCPPTAPCRRWSASTGSARHTRPPSLPTPYPVPPGPFGTVAGRPPRGP